MRYGPLGTADLPVREVADLHQHRNADLVDAESQVLVTELHIADRDRREGFGDDRLGRLDDVDLATRCPGRQPVATTGVDGDIDPLPFRRAVVGRHRCPFVTMLEPAHAQFQVALSLISASMVDDHGLLGERHDQVAVGDLVDVPRPDGADLGQLGAGIGLRLGLLGEDHQVLDAERLHVGHALGGIVVVVAKFANWIRAVAAHRRCGDEVIRRRAAGLEEQPLHAVDAAVGPVRQQHQRHGRAVLAVVAVVLPQRPPATMRRIGAEGLHLVDQRLVLAVRVATLVAGEVVTSPAVALRIFGIRRQGDRVPATDAPCIHRLAVLGDHAPAGHLLEQEQLHHQHDDADHAGRRRADLPQAASRPRAERAADHDLDELDDADHHQHQPEEIEERQQARVPQQSDDRQRVLGEEDEGGQRQATDPQPRAAEVAAHHRGNEAEQREAGDDDIEKRGPRKEHVPVRVGRTIGPAVVLHVGHVRVVGEERHDPERAQQHRRDQHRGAVDEAGAIHPNSPQQQRPEHDEDQHDAVAQHGQGQQDRRPTAELAGLQAAGEHAQSEHRERQRDRERELAGHRALDVAAVDREALVEQEDRRRQGHQFGHRVPEARQPTERPATPGQRDQAEDRHEFEGNAVRKHDVQRDDHQRRDDHVEPIQAGTRRTSSCSTR